MNKAYIKAIAYYLPEKELTNADLVNDFPDWTIEKIANKTGINARRIAGENEFASDMAIKASMLLFSEYSIEPGAIDFVLNCTQSPDYVLPTTACIIQDKLGIPITCGALDFNLGCSGYVYGLALAKGLIAAGIAKNVLLITAETYSKYIDPADRANRTIFGDAAAATLVAVDGFAEILDFELGTDGKGAENLVVKEGGTRYKAGTITNSSDSPEGLFPPGCLYMNGPEIFTFTAQMIPALVNQVLEKNTLTKADIGLFVFHQANKYMLDFLRKLIGVPAASFYIGMENYGNTVSSTIPIALYDAMAQNKLKGNVLLAGFGVGYSWGATILKFS